MSDSFKLGILDIQAYIGKWFRDVGEYIQMAEFNETNKSISGTITYNPNSAFIQDHTVSSDGRLIVRATVIVESAFVLLALLNVLLGETGNPRAIEIKKFRFSKEVEAGKDEVNIRILEIRSRSGLVFARVICCVGSETVAEGELIGISVL